MPNIAAVLKSEISRVARRELRAETESIRKAVSGYRTEIASLKRRVQALEKEVKIRSRGVRQGVRADRGEARDVRHRFSAEKLAKHRAGLSLSAADYAKLLGVSQLSVFKWESGKARPRDRYLPVIAEIRKLGKREAAARLAA
jgi:DNA-binding transcriptional regulator YiaG